MKLPTIQGIIRRRILVNYRLPPEVVQRQLPPKFRPKLHAGSAIAGICLIRLEEIRPKGMPSFFGISSENAAHRIAVLWDDEQGKTQEGVYIPRRDTNSRLNQIAGGRIFPGEHHAANFQVKDDGKKIDFSMRSEDVQTSVEVRGTTGEKLPATSKFATLTEASGFFEPGSLGYSATKTGVRLDGIRLKTFSWKVEPLDVQHVHSSYFADQTKFPEGTVSFDCALLMRNIEHEWHSEQDLHI
ncbi:MAG: hypothetical protein JWQ71_3528 [Pedosphaera sp.]|nr:hypothetical protein [Pedosphaera sp.]